MIPRNIEYNTNTIGKTHNTHQTKSIIDKPKNHITNFISFIYEKTQI